MKKIIENKLKFLQKKLYLNEYEYEYENRKYKTR